MRILIVGGGGREHALAWAISASPLCDTLFCAPGNAGIAALATCRTVAADDVDGLLRLARDESIDLVVVGPEAPLVAGLVDRLAEAGIRAFGPRAAAARLEASKAFTKAFCERHDIPAARSATFEDADAAEAYIRGQGAPIVVKADGLAAGKGVVVAATMDEAVAAARAMLSGDRHGAAGRTVVVEECLVGTEVSYFALTDGITVVPLASAQDHKRVGDGDTGPNTGGMGAMSPSPLVAPELEARILDEIVCPTVAGLAAEGTPYVGVLYAGLMIDAAGTPRLLEYNVRFGDPECQALMMRLKSDLVPALVAAVDGELHDFDLRWYEEPAVVVVVAADGYPDAYETGTAIRRLPDDAEDGTLVVFHAGTARDDAGRLVASGGRVLGVTALGDSLADARARAYAAVAEIDWPQGYFRRDIAQTASEG